MNNLLAFLATLGHRGTRESDRSKQKLILRRVEAAWENPEFEKLVMGATLASEEYLRTAQIKARIEDKLLECPLVRGVAIGASDHRDQAEGSPVISVFLEVDNHKLRDSTKNVFREASETEGLAITDRDLDALDFVETGRIIQGRNPPPFGRESSFSPNIPPAVNPVVGGVSVGRSSPRKSSGTLGICCYDEVSLDVLSYMLSNNHVLANFNKANIGDPIFQPAPEWGTYFVGTLAGFVPIERTQRDSGPVNNYIDAAIAMNSAQRNLDRDILEIGAVVDCAHAPKVGTQVQKFGAGTERSSGTITHVDATIKIDYDYLGEARFRHQIVTDRMADDGDSGSLLVSKEDEPHAIGLIFAEDQKQGQIYANSILLVEAFLGIRIAPKGKTPPDLGLP